MKVVNSNIIVMIFSRLFIENEIILEKSNSSKSKFFHYAQLPLLLFSPQKEKHFLKIYFLLIVISKKYGDPLVSIFFPFI